MATIESADSSPEQSIYGRGRVTSEGQTDPDWCTACGGAINPAIRDRCGSCRTPFEPALLAARRRAGYVTLSATTPDGTRALADLDLTGNIITRTYHGTNDEIVAQRDAEIPILAGHGFVYKSQDFVPGPRAGVHMRSGSP